MPSLLGFLPVGPWEILVILGIGLLLFGRKLPEVGRSLGKGIVEFKKGLKGLEDDIEGTVSATESRAAEVPRPPQRVAAAAPKFEDVPASPAPPGV